MEKQCSTWNVPQMPETAMHRYQLGKIYLEEDNKNIPAAIQYPTLAAKQKNEFAAYRLGETLSCRRRTAKEHRAGTALSEDGGRHRKPVCTICPLGKCI